MERKKRAVKMADAVKYHAVAFYIATLNFYVRSWKLFTSLPRTKLLPAIRKLRRCHAYE